MCVFWLAAAQLKVSCVSVCIQSPIIGGQAPLLYYGGQPPRSYSTVYLNAYDFRAKRATDRQNRSLYPARGNDCEEGGSC